MEDDVYTQSTQSDGFYWRRFILDQIEGVRDELGHHAEEVAARFHRKATLSMQEVEGRLAVQIGDTQQAGGCGAHCKCLLSTSQKLDEVRRLAEATSDDQRLADRHRDSAWEAVQQAKGAAAQAQSVA